MTTKARVLFVDDEERIVNLLRLTFLSTYEVFTATSGAKALEIIRDNDIHVIVSDQRMPGISGIELLTQVHEASPNTVRLLLTGYSDLTAIVGSVNEAEVFRFINKPWKQDEIRATLAEAVEIAQMKAPVAASAAPTEQMQKLVAGRHAGLLLLDANESDRHQVAATLGEDYLMHHAANIQEALHILENNDIGVMVCDASVNSHDVGDLLHVLKNNFPEIITVMLMRAADSEMVIRLINQARIYRFATKPIRQAVLQLAVSAAMKEHIRCIEDVRHVARHRPVKVADIDQSDIARGFLGSLKKLATRWRIFA
jgi:serine/threonine-protein kinase